MDTYISLMDTYISQMDVYMSVTCIGLYIRTSPPPIVGLNSGHIMMLRKDILDPRRNITPTQDMM